MPRRIRVASSTTSITTSKTSFFWFAERDFSSTTSSTTSGTTSSITSCFTSNTKSHIPSGAQFIESFFGPGAVILISVCFFIVAVACVCLLFPLFIPLCLAHPRLCQVAMGYIMVYHEGRVGFISYSPGSVLLTQDFAEAVQPTPEILRSCTKGDLGGIIRKTGLYMANFGCSDKGEVATFFLRNWPKIKAKLEEEAGL